MPTLVCLLSLLLYIAHCSCHLTKTVVYEKFEYCFTATRNLSNPFNYSQVNVVADINPPSQITRRIDGFYYQNFSRIKVDGKEQLKLTGKPMWCIRYAPIETGNHTVDLSIIHNGSKTMITKLKFQAIPTIDKRGFVRVAGNQIHFTFEDETVYFPIGENYCWPGNSNGTYEYDYHFTKLSENGVNYARLWLTDNDFDDLAVEISNFNISLLNTWRIDYILQLAEKLDMRLLLCTESFNCFKKSTGSKSTGYWDKDCYYNKKFGGIIDEPQKFFTDVNAITDYKMRLRYLVARYSYSTSIFAWEFFNEVDITSDYNNDDQINWVNEMSKYLKSIDPNQHMISTSFTNDFSLVQSLPGIDFTMTHRYGFSDLTREVTNIIPQKQKMYQKPSFVAEFGSLKGNPPLDDTKGISLHNGLWSPLFTMGAGTCMTWWWDKWVYRYDLYAVFKPLSDFVQQISYKAGYVWKSVNATTDFNDLRVSGMSNEFAYDPQSIIWIQDTCYIWNSNGTHCRERHGIILHFHGCEDGGVYSGAWYNTHNGSVYKPVTNLRCDETLTLNITVPSFIYDIAFLLAVAGD